MPEHVDVLPVYLDYAATFLWGVSGAIVGAHRGYDLSGVVALSLVSATGGGLLRDGLFLHNGPPVLVRTPAYLLIVAAAALLVLIAGSRLHDHRHFLRLVQIVDALGLGAYAVVGMQLAIESDLSLPGVVLVGIVNAVGGGALRDLLTRQEPEVFKPGTLTATAVLASCLVFLVLEKGLDFAPTAAAWPTIFTAFTIRLLSIRYDIRTRPLSGFPAKASTE
jgi:uncharacterized membrane protein YeiH